MADAINDAAKGAGAGAAIGGPVGGVIGGIAGLVGGGISALLGRKANAKEQQAWDAYEQSLQAQGIPDASAFVAQYGFVDPTQLKQYNPAGESAVNLGQTELKGIQTNPQYQQAQMQALQQLQQRAQGGLTPEDMAARDAIMRNMGASVQSNNQNVLQNLAQRGMLGGGTEIAARMAGIQGAYENAAQQGEALAAQKSSNALQAGQAAGNLGGQMQSTQFGQQAQVANAQDVINKFNTANQQAIQQRNVAGQNTAQEANANLLNNAYNTNLNLKNTQANQLMQGGLQSQNLANARAVAVAQAKLNQAQGAKANAVNTATGVGQIATNLGTTIQSLANRTPQAGSTQGPKTNPDGSISLSGTDETDKNLYNA